VGQQLMLVLGIAEHTKQMVSTNPAGLRRGCGYLTDWVQNYRKLGEDTSDNNTVITALLSNLYVNLRESVVCTPVEMMYSKYFSHR